MHEFLCVVRTAIRGRKMDLWTARICSPRRRGRWTPAATWPLGRWFPHPSGCRGSWCAISRSLRQCSSPRVYMCRCVVANNAVQPAPTYPATGPGPGHAWVLMKPGVSVPDFSWHILGIFFGMLLSWYSIGHRRRQIHHTHDIRLMGMLRVQSGVHRLGHAWSWAPTVPGFRVGRTICWYRTCLFFFFMRSAPFSKNRSGWTEAL